MDFYSSPEGGLGILRFSGEDQRDLREMDISLKAMFSDRIYFSMGSLPVFNFPFDNPGRDVISTEFFLDDRNLLIAGE